MEVDFDIITVGKALLVLGLAYLLSGMVSHCQIPKALPIVVVTRPFTGIANSEEMNAGAA